MGTKLRPNLAYRDCRDIKPYPTQRGKTCLQTSRNAERNKIDAKPHASRLSRHQTLPQRTEEQNCHETSRVEIAEPSNTSPTYRGTTFSQNLTRRDYRDINPFPNVERNKVVTKTCASRLSRHQTQPRRREEQNCHETSRVETSNPTPT